MLRAQMGPKIEIWFVAPVPAKILLQMSKSVEREDEVANVSGAEATCLCGDLCDRVEGPSAPDDSF
jgi:hypothetical protein